MELTPKIVQSTITSYVSQLMADLGTVDGLIFKLTRAISTNEVDEVMLRIGKTTEQIFLDLSKNYDDDEIVSHVLALGIQQGIYVTEEEVANMSGKYTGMDTLHPCFLVVLCKLVGREMTANVFKNRQAFK